MSTRARVLALWVLHLLFCLPPAFGQVLPQVEPEQAGLSSTRLARIHAAVQRRIDRGEIPGAVMLIARRGKIAYLDTLGMMNIEERKPMRTNTIFQIRSMTKPITSVAVMLLYEEGHFLLSDPISRFIPAFKNPRVAVSRSPGEDTLVTVPAEREITIRDLLTHTSGLTYGGPGITADVYEERAIAAGARVDASLGDMVNRLGEVPLNSQPGTTWQYSYATDVLGYLVEVVSGMSLDQFFRERILKPLGMTDTHFFLPEDKAPRFATVYTPDERGGLKMTSAPPYHLRGPKRFFSGGGGLVSTVPDYFRFSQMLLNGGELDGVRLLSPKTVQLMTVNHTRDLLPVPGYGFGLGFAVCTDVGESALAGSVGTYTWSGALNTYFWIDPEEELVGIFMTHLEPWNPRIFEPFRVLAYQAVVEASRRELGAGTGARP